MKPEEHLGELIKIKIDRPLGSKHPEHGFIYPINYGFVPGVIGGDGEELDAYLLGVFEPVEEYEGRLIAIVYREDDIEEKLVVAPKPYTADQISALIEFQERWFHSWIAYCYDKPYWPEEFSIEMPEVRKAIETALKDGEYSTTSVQTAINKGYGFCKNLGFWLEDKGIVGKELNLKPRKLEIKSLEEALNKIKDKK